MALQKTKHKISKKLAIIYVRGDITRVTADAIVIGEGPHLDRKGQVTTSLIKIAPFVQVLRCLLKEMRGTLPLWTAHTSELCVPFRYVIHAVLDKGNNDQWLKNMKHLYKQIFTAADSLKISSVAVPLLGSGAADTERSLSVKAVVTSVLEYSPKYLTDIMLVSNDATVIDMIDTQIQFQQSGHYEPHSSGGIIATVYSWFKYLLSLVYYDSQPDIQSLSRGRGGNHKRQHAYGKEGQNCHSHSTAFNGHQSNKRSGNKDHPSVREHREKAVHQHARWKGQVQMVMQKSRAEAGLRKRYQDSSKGLHPKASNLSTSSTSTFEHDMQIALQLSEEEAAAKLKPRSFLTQESYETPNELYNSASDDDTFKDLNEEKDDFNIVKDYDISENNTGTTGTGLGKQPSENDTDRTCPICLNTIIAPTRLDKCGHIFCKDCIERSFRDFKPVCPSCNMVYGVITGNQPKGKMNIDYIAQSLPGHLDCGTLSITYIFHNGTQQEDHPNPGQPYKGTTRKAYLPDSREGNAILELLKTAFDRKLTFTIGRSTTTGRDGVVTWNDIHHKTNMDGGPTRFGYPDPTYLSRVRDELASKGVS